MKVVITSQSLDRLEESLLFYIEELGIPIEKVSEIKTQLLNRARSLPESPYIGQLEPYLKKFNKNHRRLIQGNFKIIYRVEESSYM